MKQFILGMWAGEEDMYRNFKDLDAKSHASHLVKPALLGLSMPQVRLDPSCDVLYFHWSRAILDASQ